MAYNKNTMRASFDYLDYYNDKVHQNSSFHLSKLPSSSTVPSDLPGFLCPLETHQELQPQIIYGFALPRGLHKVPIQFPPSPPPTNSDPKRNVPLPSLGSNAEAGPSSPRRSPNKTNSVAQNIGLMTPPSIFLTPALELPADVELSPIPTEHDGWNASLLSLPSASNSPEENNAMDHLLSPISPEWTTKRLFSSTDSYSYLQESHDNDTSPHCRPILPHLDIPYPFSPSSSPSSWVDEEDELDMLATPSTIDMDMPSTPISLPSSPLTPELGFKPDDELFENDFRRYYDPPVHEFEFLPELDDIPDSPSSPSLRCFSTLPALDEEDDFDDGVMMTSPPSPGATLLSLPGADTDDFLIPPESTSQPWIPSFNSSSSSLLLLEDEGIPRSPSPDNCDVDISSIEDSTDPDICRLSELRKRSQNTERATRQMEQMFLEQGAVHQRWEARRTWKKEKERSREIGAMLRLKLAQEKQGMEGVVETEGEREGVKSMKRRKGAISSMEQLVAKMMLRRNETYRSLADRKTPLTSKFHTSSPLARHSVLASEMDDDYRLISEPWTPSAWTPSSICDCFWKLPLLILPFTMGYSKFLLGRHLVPSHQVLTVRAAGWVV
ncbi:hypothetical protein H0H92_004264 [Tricholoma furcatifolium]|nr:hypothetical protein H0H92_004264 [Tricholoma furcatifolium]